jgi:transposase-like protein
MDNNIVAKVRQVHGKWFVCPVCKKKYWRYDWHIKREGGSKACSIKCLGISRSKCLDYQDEIIRLYASGYSMEKISKKFDFNHEGVARFLRAKGISIRSRNTYNIGSANHKYKGGHISQNGYRRLSAPGGKQIMEHRKVMEEFLGRKLGKNEHVHHLNGNKLDNRIENLSIYTPDKHSKLHSKQFNDFKKMYQARIYDLEEKLKLYER